MKENTYCFTILQRKYSIAPDKSKEDVSGNFTVSE